MTDWMPLITVLGVTAALAAMVALVVVWQRAQATRARVEDRLEEITAASGLLISRVDSHGRVTGASNSMVELIGSDPSQTPVSEGLDLLIHPDDLQDRRSAHAAVRRGSESRRSCSYRLRGRSGRWHVITEIVRRADDVDDPGALECIGWDRSDQDRYQRQQERLTYLNELSTTFLESFLVTDDIEWTTRVMIDALGRHLGTSRLSLIERTDGSDHYEITHRWPDDAEDSSPDRRTTMDSFTSQRMAWWMEQVRGGVPFFIAGEEGGRSEEETTLHALTSCELVMIAPILVKGELQMMLMIEDPDNQLDLDAAAISTVQTLVHGIARSIERQLDNERQEEFKDKLQRLERTQAVGQLASVTTHDMNNVLFAVSGRAQLMSKTIDDPKVLEGLEEILDAVADARQIMGNLGQINKRIERRDGVVRVGPEIQRYLKMFKHLTQSQTTIDLRLRIDNDACAPCPSDALHQILMNLVVNARDAIEGEGVIRITADESGPDDRPIRITVEDDGPGIPEERYDDVCRDFHTTKEASGGTGLGLGIVSRFVRNHDGLLAFSRSDLGGLRVTIDFPSVEAPGEEMSEETLTSPGMQEAGISRCAIIEDDGQVGNLIADDFQQAGIVASHFENAESFLEHLSRCAPDERPDILVMDIELPGQSGLDCLKELRNGGMETPCVLMTSGYMDHPTEIPGMRLMRKPFSMDTLHANCSILVMRQREDRQDDPAPD